MPAYRPTVEVTRMGAGARDFASRQERPVILELDHDHELPPLCALGLRVHNNTLFIITITCHTDLQ
jgi:arginase family enzyme